MYFGSGSKSGSGEGTNETEIDADREDDDSDDENDNEGSGISNVFAPANPPLYTEQPYLHHVHKGENANDNNDKSIILEETHMGSKENTEGFDKGGSFKSGISIQIGKSQKPLDTNQWEKTSGINNVLNTNNINNQNNGKNNIGHYDDVDVDIDYKSTAECHGRCVTNKMSLRRALILYLVPLYLTWLGGMIDGVL